MMLDILVHIHRDDEQQTRLLAAADLADRLKGHITCVQIAPEFGALAADPFGGIYFATEADDEQKMLDGYERQRISEWLRQRGVAWTWKEISDDPVHALVQAGRFFDLMVLSAGLPLTTSGKSLPIAGHVAIHSPAPILVLPHGAAPHWSGVAAIAWNGSLEACRALRGAAPLLLEASMVHFLIVDGDRDPGATDEARTWLERRGIPSKLRELKRQPGATVSDTLVDAVEEVGASYLVMGAYGHSRALEVIFGGVTQHLLETMPIPLVMAH